MQLAECSAMQTWTLFMLTELQIGWLDLCTDHLVYTECPFENKPQPMQSLPPEI